MAVVSIVMSGALESVSQIFGDDGGDVGGACGGGDKGHGGDGGVDGGDVGGGCDGGGTSGVFLGNMKN